MRIKAERRVILAVQVGEEDVVFAQALAEVVEATVGVFFHAPEPGQVVLVDIVVTRTEQAHAERVVDKQKTAEIRGNRLNADAQAVEIVAVGHVAQVLVEVQVLHAEMRIGARLAVVGVDPERAQFVRVDAVVIGHRGKAVLVIGRAKNRIALVIHHRHDQVFDEDGLFVGAEHVELAGAAGGLRTDRGRHVAWFEHCV